jgi:hypothetical protein
MPAVASAANDDMVILGMVIVVDESGRLVRVYRQLRTEFQFWNLSLKIGGPGSVYLYTDAYLVRIQGY